MTVKYLLAKEVLFATDMILLDCTKQQCISIIV